MPSTTATQDWTRLRDDARAEHDALRGRGLALDLTRGKPAPDQLDLAAAMIQLPEPGDWFTASGEDARNYGGLQGLAEVRAMFGALLGAPAAQVVVGDNSSLALMHDAVLWALTRGVPGSPRPWSKEAAPAFLCPVPGYDRHFAILEHHGIRMIPVPLTGHGPDMEAVETLARDPAVKGMWCMPLYSNPTGDIYDAETVRRLAAMPAGAPDFRLFWDNAYVAHHLTETPHRVPDILAECDVAGHADRAFVFASTSKMTLAGAGLAFFASSPANVRWWLENASFRTIGPDKVNQLRHMRFLKDAEGLAQHMERHRALIAPKFAAVTEALERRLGNLGGVRWTRPQGGYFISLDLPPGTAKRVVELAKEVGLALTPAGATWPGGQDPQDSNLRIAPTYPSLADVRQAAEVICSCVLLAVAEQRAA
jgi:DNA-binding transcriptional MocR family regulator